MALPFSPRGTYTRTIDLNVTDIRTFNSTTYWGQHILIIPKTTIDTSRALVFWSAASVTIIGGHFRPGANGWGYNAESGTGSKAPGTLNFNNCGEVYLEGVLIDNQNLFVDNPEQGENGGDAVFLSGKSANTNFTVQNCAWINVRGVQIPLEAHADIFQTASRTQGATGAVNFYNFTGSGDYQGFFLDPQTRPSGVTDYPDGKIGSITLRKVNLKRTAQKTLKHQLLFLFSSEDAYNSRGYPATFDEVWLDGLTGDTLEDLVWPRNGPASNGQFTNVKYQATFDTDSTGRYAEWRGLTDPGKIVSGKVYEGSPPTGDFCPPNLIGLGYVQGTEITPGGVVTPTYRSTLPARFAAITTQTFLDLRRTLAGSSVLDAITLTPVADGVWTEEGTGTMTVNSPTSIDLVASGTKSARVTYPTIPGQNYVFTFDLAGQAANVSVGTNPAANNLNGGILSPIGTGNQVSFTALTSISYVKFATTVSGSLFLSNLAIALSIWAVTGPGTVTNQTNTTITITGAGGNPTSARRVITTVPGQQYTVTWTSDSATGTWAVGNTLDGDELVAAGPSFTVGSNTSTFTATATTTYLRFQRTSIGVVNLTNINIAQTSVLAWTGGGAGTTTITSDTQVVLNAVGTTPTYARRTFLTTEGRKYTFAHSWAGNTGNIKLGTTAGGEEIMPSRSTVGGANSHEFVSDVSPTHVEISRAAAGSATVTDLSLTELSPHAWYSGGPGAVAITDNSSFTLAGTGTGTTYVIRPISTIKDREYIWTFNVGSGTPGRMVGSTFGNTDLAPLVNATTGLNSVKFAAISHQSWLRIQQVAASGNIAVSNISYSLVPFENSINWTISGTGTTSIDANQTVTINGNGTVTAARRSYNTIPGKMYRLTINVTGGATQYQVGTSEGGTQLVGATLVQPGTYNIEFTATTAVTHFHCQRVTTGFCVVTRPVMSVIAASDTVFPVVQSFNDTNLGGIGKPYWFVDRLSDSATDGSGNRGSLRYCLQNSIGNDRLILSEVQGRIVRTADLGILADRNNVTIAAFTGPGPIVLAGSYKFSIRGQNNVIEHLCIERSYSAAGAGDGDCLSIVSTGGRTVRNILIRNCFTAYGQDEAMQIYHSRNQADNEQQDIISLHWNIFTNALKDPKEYNPAFLSNTNVDNPGQDGNHNFNVLVGGYTTQVDIQKNLMMNSLQRNPRFSAPVTNALVANNVIFNWGYGGIGFQSEQDDYEQTNNPPGSLRYAISCIGNIGIPGPDTTRAELISQHGGGRLGGNSLIHIANNSIIQGLNAALTATANTIGFQNPHFPEFPGIQSARQDTLTLVQAIAQAQLMREMELNAGPFPKMRAANPNLLLGVTQAIGQMKNLTAGKYINHEDEGPGMSNPPFISRPLTGNLAPPTDYTNVAQVQAWLQERRLEVSYA